MSPSNVLVGTDLLSGARRSFSIGPDSAVSIPPSASSAISTLEAFRVACHTAGLRLVDLFTLALDIPDKDYFRSRHSYGKNESLRLLHYPSFPKGGESDEGQDGKTKWEEMRVGEKDIRAGAHQDFGSWCVLAIAWRSVLLDFLTIPVRLLKARSSFSRRLRTTADQRP